MTEPARSPRPEPQPGVADTVEGGAGDGKGIYWLLKHVPFGHDWVRAEKDAPWHRNTNLQVNIATMYPRARIDWWFLDYGRNHLAVGLGLMLALAGGLAGGVILMVRRLWR